MSRGVSGKSVRFSVAIRCTSGCFCFRSQKEDICRFLRLFFFLQGVQVLSFRMFRHGGEFDRVACGQGGDLGIGEDHFFIKLSLIPS